MPRNSAGRVYSGCCRTPVVMESSATLSGEPTTPGEQARNGVNDDHGGQFSPGQDIISGADLPGGKALSDAFVHTCVVAADEGDGWGLDQLLHEPLGKEARPGASSGSPGCRSVQPENRTREQLRRPRRPAPVSSPCRGRRRTGNRRRCHGRRGCGRGCWSRRW